MITLTKVNGELITINSFQIEFIELIPESKVNMMNGKYHIVKESPEEIIEKVIQFNRESLQDLKGEK